MELWPTGLGGIRRKTFSFISLSAYARFFCMVSWPTPPRRIQPLRYADFRATRTAVQSYGSLFFGFTFIFCFSFFFSYGFSFFFSFWHHFFLLFFLRVSLSYLDSVLLCSSKSSDLHLSLFFTSFFLYFCPVTVLVTFFFCSMPRRYFFLESFFLVIFSLFLTVFFFYFIFYVSLCHFLSSLYLLHEKKCLYVFYSGSK